VGVTRERRMSAPTPRRGGATCPGLMRAGLCEPGTGMAIMAGDPESQLSGKEVIMLEYVFEYLLSPVLSSPERDRGGGSDEQRNRRRDA